MTLEVFANPGPPAIYSTEVDFRPPTAPRCSIPPALGMARKETLFPPHRTFGTDIRRVIIALLIVLSPAFAAAETSGARALIFVGLATNEAPRLRRQADDIRAGLIARGFSPDAVQVFPGDGGFLRREQVLEALAATPSATAETWVVLLGTVAPGRNAEPAFQVSGPRLLAAEFAAAVAKAPGKKLVLIGTAAGGGFLPALLEMPDVEAVAATAAHGEVNEPRFPAYWAEALAARPGASFAELAATAAGRVETFYKENTLAQSEHAHRLDRKPNRIVAVAAGSSAAAATGASPAAQPAAPIEASAIVIPRPANDLEVERRPATDETRAMVQAAQREAAGLPDAALALAVQAEFTVASDRSITERWAIRSFVRTAEAVDDIATLDLPHGPPLVFARLEAARVIKPDGSQLLVNPRPLESRAAANRAENNRARQFASPTAIELPEVAGGCLVECAWSVERKSTHEIPELHQEWRFGRKFPVRSLQVRLQLPGGNAWRHFSRGFSDERNHAEAGTRTISWSLADLPAYEPAAGAPPMREAVPWIGVSSLPSWDHFSAWYRRLSAGSEETGPGFEALAARIARDHPGRAERLRAAYEAVAALRYVAIELGVGAFRPRTPEQVWAQHYGDCKDKANLLVALLRRLGVGAEFALINRFDTTFTEFPGWQFNHALVRVPAAPADGQATDLWLDTTDRLVPFGVIAPGDAGRPAFAFPAGLDAGRFIEVVAAQEPPAEWRESWRLSPGAAGSAARGKVTLAATGFAEASLRRLFADLTPARRAARLHALLGIDTLTLEGISATDAYDLATPFRIEATVGAVFPADILPRPPWFDDAFSAAARTATLAFAEGRPARYVQEIHGSPGTPARERTEGASGFVFRETGSGASLTREVSIPPAALAPADYPAVRAAWHRFLQHPPHQP